MTRVEIEWWDSERVTLGWDTRKAYRKALADRTVYRTCGYLVGEDADSVMVALSRNPRGRMYSEAIVIPRAVIIRRHELRTR